MLAEKKQTIALKKQLNEMKSREKEPKASNDLIYHFLPEIQ